MSRNSIKATETLMLRRIDPVLILRKYLAGDYSNVKIPQSKISFSTAFVDLNQRIGSDQSSEIFRFNDKTNSGQLIVTTNHEQYRYAKDISEGKECEKPIAHCRWCNREIFGDVLRIPTSMTTDKHTKQVSFEGEDTTDTFGCALAVLKRIYLCGRMFKDPRFRDAIQILHCLFWIVHPNMKGCKIVEAKDPRLLKYPHGGPLTDEEYDSDQFSYIMLPHVVSNPVKRQYIKLKVGTKK